MARVLSFNALTVELPYIQLLVSRTRNRVGWAGSLGHAPFVLQPGAVEASGEALGGAGMVVGRAI